MSLINNMKKAILNASHNNRSDTPSKSEKTDCYSSSVHCPPGITIASFRGQEDPIQAADWIDMYDAIAADYNYSEANKIIRLGGHLRKYALSWYVEEMKRYGGDLHDCNWYSLKDSFKRYFVDCNIIGQDSDTSSVISSYGG